MADQPSFHVFKDGVYSHTCCENYNDGGPNHDSLPEYLDHLANQFNKMITVQKVDYDYVSDYNKTR